uniref:Coiled-coil-helix-coiled-coil-helix domain containing 6b n=1 Tax=Takifugu rubripes TaxID=31033 RepID=A0A674NRR3_TAKRU
MGGNGSTNRKVSFGMDEDEKVTVIEGVKLSADVLRRMRESEQADNTKSPSSVSDNQKDPSSAKPTGPSSTEIQEEIRKNFERQQSLVQEQLAKLAQRERESAAAKGLDELTPAFITEKQKAYREQENAKMLARQLESKEKELASISGFYKEQLEILEKKNFDNFKQTVDQYNQAATQAETRIRTCNTASVCTELQSKVLQCYRENPQQTLHCSSLAKQYMACVQRAKVSSEQTRPLPGA